MVKQQPKRAQGKAFSGGLGKRKKEQFRTWVCMRDWDPQEQRMCGLGLRELGCFYFEVCAAAASKIALSAVLSAEGRVVGPCWGKLKPKGPKVCPTESSHLLTSEQSRRVEYFDKIRGSNEN